MPPLKRSSRLLDVASLVLVLAGATCVGGSYVGMRRLRDSAHDPKAPIFAGYTRHVRLTQLSYLGFGALAGGVMLAVYAAMHARKA